MPRKERKVKSEGVADPLGGQAAFDAGEVSDGYCCDDDTQDV